MKGIISILSLLFCFHFAHGQNTTNPFEIVDRTSVVDSISTEVEEPFLMPQDGIANLQTIATEKNDSIVVAVPISTLPEGGDNNPFEILDSESHITPSENIEEAVKKEQSPIEQPKRKPTHTFLDKFQPVGKGSENRGQLFGVVLLALIPIAILFTIFRSFFTKAYQNVVNTSLLAQSQREFVGAIVIPMNIWYVAFWINAGVFLSLLMYVYEVSFTMNHLVNALLCIGIVGGLLLSKHILLSFMAVIFPITKEIRLYSYLLLVFGIVAGVFLMPVNIAIIYAPNNVTKLLIYSSLAIITLLYFIRSFRVLIVTNRLLALHKFHFLLYICTVEIAPIILLVKLGILYLDLNT